MMENDRGLLTLTGEDRPEERSSEEYVFSYSGGELESDLIITPTFGGDAGHPGDYTMVDGDGMAFAPGDTLTIGMGDDPAEARLTLTFVEDGPSDVEEGLEIGFSVSGGGLPVDLDPVGGCWS